MPHKITYTEEETTPRWAAGYRLTFKFKREMPFLRHVMQQTIKSEKEHGHDIGYSKYKIRRSRYRVAVKFMKYSGLHPIKLRSHLS